MSELFPLYCTRAATYNVTMGGGSGSAGDGGPLRAEAVNVNLHPGVLSNQTAPTLLVATGPLLVNNGGLGLSPAEVPQAHAHAHAQADMRWDTVPWHVVQYAVVRAHGVGAWNEHVRRRCSLHRASTRVCSHRPSSIHRWADRSSRSA